MLLEKDLPSTCTLRDLHFRVDPGNFVANYFSHRDNHMFSICVRRLPSLAREIPTAVRAEVIIVGYPKIITIFNIPGI